jgi:hypothetical protein
MARINEGNIENLFLLSIVINTAVLSLLLLYVKVNVILPTLWTVHRVKHELPTTQRS